MSTSSTKELHDHVDQLELDDSGDDDVNNNNNNNKDDKETIELSDSMIERPESPPPLPNDEDRDEEIEDFARQFKSIYESKFVEYLKSLKPNEPLNGTSLPDKKYNKHTFGEDDDSATTIVFYFEKLEVDETSGGHVNAVVAKSFDKTEMCHFQPHLINAYGPYFNVNLFCCSYNTGRADDKTREFFLDLPIALYNLIE